VTLNHEQQKNAQTKIPQTWFLPKNPIFNTENTQIQAKIGLKRRFGEKILLFLNFLEIQR